MSLFPRQSFGPTCPSGGTWYACSSGTNFVGCCARNPCTTMCAYGDLYQAGFNAAAHGTFPDASCGASVSFYTCAAGNTFLGCCKSNPCNNGGVCPRSDLEPAILNRDDQKSAYLSNGGLTSTSVSATRQSSTLTTTASGTTTASTTASTTTGTSSKSTASTATIDVAAATVSPHKDGPPVAAIAGGAAGGAFALAVVIGLLIYYICHAKKSRKGHEETVSRRQSIVPDMMAAHQQSKDKADRPPDAPPGYVSPNPNDYYGAHAGQYQSYALNQPHAPEIQELPIEPHVPLYHPQKPLVNTHQRHASELSGDTAIRSELAETPRSPPGQYTNALPSHHEQTQYIAYSPTASSPTDARSSWMPHQSWQSQPGPRSSYNLQGLGVHESGMHDPNLQWEQQSQADIRRYSGM